MKRNNQIQLTLNLQNATKEQKMTKSNLAANENGKILYLADKVKEQKKVEEAMIYGNIIARIQHMLD